MLQQFLKFESFITPTVMKAVYYVMAALTLLIGVVSVVNGLGMMGHDFAAGLGALVAAVIGTGLGIIFWRVSVEAVIAFFQIRDALVEGEKSHGPGDI